MADFDFSKSQLEILKQMLEYPNDIKYPVGSIIGSDDPDYLANNELKGTWQNISGRFLLGANDTYPSGKTGGSADATLVNHTHRGVYTFDASYSIIHIGTKMSGDFYSLALADSSAGHYITAPYAGEDGTGKNMPPYLAKYMWIKTKLESETQTLIVEESL